jgi:RNA polymerase sigma-70 factor (ECF subfamily)
MSADRISHIAREMPYLRRFSRCLVADKDAADDLVRDCLVEALAKPDGEGPAGDLRAWLYGILWSRFEASQQHAKRRSETASDPAQPGFGTLGDDERAVLGLVMVDGMGYTETAKILRLDVRTVRLHLSHARHALADAPLATNLRGAAR